MFAAVPLLLAHSALAAPLASPQHFAFGAPPVLLTAGMIETARMLPRGGWFHPEPGLPEGKSAELGDYVRPGFDRGRMVSSR